MKLLLITPSFYSATYYGGPIYSTFELAKAIKKQGIDIKVITTNANGSESLNIKTGVFNKLENELPVKYYKSLDSRGTSLSMLRELRTEIKKADIVYLISIFSAPTPFVVRICKKLNKPLIISPRGQLGEWCLKYGNPFKKLWLHFFIEPFLRYLNWHLTSQDEEKSVLSVYPSAKTFVIPNGIDLRKIENRDQRLEKNIREYYILILGRIDRIKGFDILIPAFANVNKQFFSLD